MSEIYLQLNNRQYKGWQEISIIRSMENLCGSFALGIKETSEDVGINWNTQAKIYIDETLVMTGNVEVVKPSYSKSGRALSVAGRDLAGDLVDCSVAGTGEYLKTNFKSIITGLVIDFGIAINLDSIKDFIVDKFATETGMTVYDALKKLCNKYGYLAISDETGMIHFQKASQNIMPIILKEGKNILDASASYDSSSLYSEITVLGQQNGSPARGILNITENEGFATNLSMKRHRPLVKVSDGETNVKTAQEQADWIKTDSIAKSKTISVTVQGWFANKTELWKPNSLVMVDSPFIKWSQIGLITEVTYKFSPTSGTTTELKIVDKNSYQLPEVSEDEDENAGGGYIK